MYSGICLYTHTYIYIYAYTYMYAHASIYIYVSTNKHTCIHTKHTHTHTQTHTHTYPYTPHTPIHTHTHTHTRTSPKWHASRGICFVLCHIYLTTNISTQTIIVTFIWRTVSRATLKEEITIVEMPNEFLIIFFLK